MTDDSHVTTGEISKLCGGVPHWRVRRVVDSLPIEIPRAAMYRLVPITVLPLVQEELKRRGWLTEQEVAAR